MWFRPTAEGVYPHQPLHDHPLLGVRSDANGRVWTGLIDLEGQPWLNDHAVEGVSVLPAAAILEMALAAARAIWPESAVLETRDLQILSALTVEPGIGRETRFTLEAGGRFRLESRQRLSGGGWVLNAVGKVLSGLGEARPAPSVAPMATISAAQVYAAAADLSLDYGPQFQVVSEVSVGEAGAAEVRFTRETAPREGRIVSVERFDGALQGFLALQLAAQNDFAAGESLLPERFGRVRAFAPFGAAPARARLQVEGVGDRTVRGSLNLMDDAGRVVATAEDCVFRRVRLSRPDRAAAQTFRFETIGSPLVLQAATLDVDALLAAVTPTQDGRLQELSTLFRAALVAVIHDAVRKVAGADHFWMEGRIASGRLSDRTRTLMAAMLHELAANDLASLEDDGGWRLSPHALAASGEIWNTILAEAPGASAELAALAELTERLPAILKGDDDGDVLSTIEPVLFGSQAGRAGLAALEDALAES